MLEMKMVENFSRYPAISFNFYDIFWDGIINFLFFFFFCAIIERKLTWRNSLYFILDK